MKHTLLATLILTSLCSLARGQFPVSVAIPGDLATLPSAGAQ